ncbi:hypothetical protein [Propionibacterium sp.]
MAITAATNPQGFVLEPFTQMKQSMVAITGRLFTFLSNALGNGANRTGVSSLRSRT